MSIGKLLHETLRQAGQPAGAEPERELRVTDGQTAARLGLFDCDRYSITLRSLELTRGQATAPDDLRERLSGVAAEVTRRLSFLEEPLAVWELDHREGLAQLRSSPPLREGEEVFYWEVALDGSAELRATVGRYRWAPGMPEREPVAYPATFTLVARIADALDAALA
jgi:hypothetical protein